MVFSLTRQNFKTILILSILGKVYLTQATYNFQKPSVANFDAFFNSDSCHDQEVLPLVRLINYIGEHYFSLCSPVVLYEIFNYENHPFVDIMAQLFKTFPVPMIHGFFTTTETSVIVSHELFLPHEAKCIGFIVLSQTFDTVAKLLGHQPANKVVLITQATNWQMVDYFQSRESQQIFNLLVIGDPILQRTFKDKDPWKAFDINMYTHDLYIDSMGASREKLLTAWRCDRLTRPQVNLFPEKVEYGFNGYRFHVSAVEHPPYVYHKSEHTFEYDRLIWDGIEIRLLGLISNFLNFTIDIQEPLQTGNNLSGYALNEIQKQKAEIGIGGIFSTADSANNFHLSQCYYEDCAVFLSLTSLALPKYQAIMGPFRWEVWMTLTLTYLLAIFPISFSESHSLKHLLKDPWEIENMFWYVFGTFTNLFTFTGKKSWTSGGRMTSTGMFIGVYWTFSIIITAAYTGSIIAFITIPVFPNVIDSLWQLLEENYRISTVNGSGWEVLFNNSGEANPKLQKLFNKMEVVPTLGDGIMNVTNAKYLRNYALLGSKELLKHVVQTNYTPDSDHRKSLFHVSQDCYVRLLISIVFAKNATFAEKFNGIILRALQNGLLVKMTRDIQWEVHRSAKGRLLQVSSARTLKITAIEDRQLTLDDVQGMFLLLGAGFAIAMAAITAEFFSHLCHKYCPKEEKNTSQVPSIIFTSYDEQLSSSKQTNIENHSKSDEFLAYFGSKVILDSSDTHSLEINNQANQQPYSASHVIDCNKDKEDWLRRYSF